MPNYRGQVCKFTWGAGYANTLYLGYPLDAAKAYPGQREGTETKQYRSGVEDAWDGGTDQFLAGSARYIPRETGVSGQGVTQTGWNGATGFDAFLTWARLKNIVRFYPDYVNAPGTYYAMYLVEPFEADGIELEDDFTRRVALVLRTADGSRVDGY